VLSRSALPAETNTSRYVSDKGPYMARVNLSRENDPFPLRSITKLRRFERESQAEDFRLFLGESRYLVRRNMLSANMLLTTDPLNPKGTSGSCRCSGNAC